MYILPAGPVSRMELRIPPEFMRPIAAPVQKPGWASFTYCNSAETVRMQLIQADLNAFVP
jgi:hypothetical protein